MRIGIPREVKNREYRVSVTPAGVHRLVSSGHEVLVETGAGAGSALPDEQYVAAGARIVADARAKGEKVIHIRHEFTGPDSPFFAPGSEGAQIHPSMAPAAGEAVILKNQVNAFLGTGLKQLLDEAGTEEVTVVGAMSHMCIDAATRASSDFGYKTTVIHDACATLDLEFDGKVVPAAQVHSALMSALAKIAVQRGQALEKLQRQLADVRKHMSGEVLTLQSDLGNLLRLLDVANERFSVAYGDKGSYLPMTLGLPDEEAKPFDGPFDSMAVAIIYGLMARVRLE